MSIRKHHLQRAIAVLALAAAPAWAGFINEQATATPQTPGTRALAQAMSHSGVGASAVSGGFLTPEWLAPMEVSAADLTLASALMQMLPVGSAPVVLAPSKPELLDRKVSFTRGESRMAVLRRASAQHALYLRLDLATRQVVITEMSAQPAPAQTGAAAPVVAAAPAPAAQAPVRVAAAPAPAAPVAAPADISKTFVIRPGDVHLARVFERWAQENGVRIRWDADRHVLVGAPMTYQHRDVFEAVADVLSSPSIRFGDYPLEVCEYPNVPRLLRITRQGDQTRECAGGSAVAEAK